MILVNLTLKKLFGLRVTTDGENVWRSNFRPDLSVSASVELARQAVFEAKIPSLHAARTMLKRTWDMNGHSLETQQLARQLVERFDKNSDPRVNDIKIMRAAIALQASNFKVAIDLGEEVLRNGSSFQLTMPAALVAALHLSGSLRTEWSYNCLKAMETASKAEANILSLLTDTSKSLCIVGNSPCEKGEQRGMTIDAHDVVIRFNNFEVSSDYSGDYGLRTSIWARAKGGIDVHRRPYSAFSYVLYTGPDLRYHADSAHDIVDCVAHSGQPCFIPASVYGRICSALDSRPSAGLTVAYWLRLMRGSPDGSKFSIFGMSLTDQDSNQSKQYFESGIKRRSYSHNWQKEAHFLQEKILN